MSRRIVGAAVVAAFLLAVAVYYRHQAAEAREAAEARHVADCKRMLVSITSLRRGFELTQRPDENLIMRHGTASLLLVPMVAICTGDEDFASGVSQQFGEAQTWKAAAAALQSVEDRMTSRQ